MKEGGLCEPDFWRGEGLCVPPKFPKHTAAFWPGSAKTELLSRAPCSEETVSLSFHQSGAKPDVIQVKEGKKNVFGLLFFFFP